MNIVSWSGGKDSTATLILAHEKGVKIDVAIISLPMFDKKRNIYADSPEHIEWLFGFAIPKIESWGIKVKVVSSDKDYLYHFKHIIRKSKIPERNGKMGGWLLGRMCKMQGEKVKPIKNYIKSLPPPFWNMLA